MALIGQAVSEEKIFEIVDGRTDDGRTPDHGHPISSPCEPNGSGELKIGIPPANSSFSIYRSGVYGGIHIIDILFLMLCKIFKFFSDSNVTLITKH